MIIALSMLLLKIGVMRNEQSTNNGLNTPVVLCHLLPDDPVRHESYGHSGFPIVNRMINHEN